MADSVFLRTAPPFPFGGFAPGEVRAFLLYAGLDPLNLGSHEGKAYLMVAAPFDAALSFDLSGPPFPFGAFPFDSAIAFTSMGNTATIYPAATGNAARSTANDDTPAATWVPGKLSGAFNYEVSLFAGNDPTQGGGGTLGILEFVDPDGELDALRTLGWDGAPIELRRGEPDAYFSTYRTVAMLSAAGIRYDLGKKEILLRNLAWKLETELHGDRYAGTGGANGDAILKGRIKPIAFGSVFNISPVQVNATTLIYQVSCTSVLAIDAVRDGGVPLTIDTDYPTYDTLAVAPVGSGHYATCKAQGLFKLGAAPVYKITADVRGDNDTLNGLGYPHTRAQIARRIATGRGNVRLRDPQDIDGNSFEYLEQWQTATVGRFWDAEITKAAALSELMAGVAGWWGVRLSGRLAIGQLEDPSFVAAELSLDFAPTDTEMRVGEPAVTDWQPPRRATVMGWKRNYTPQAVNEIAGSVSQADSAIYQAVSRFVQSESLWVSSGYPSATVATIDGGFTTEADAQLEADRQRRLFGQVREVVEIPVVMDPFADVAGRVLRVLNCGRLGLSALANGFVFGIAVNGNGKPILKLWK